LDVTGFDSFTQAFGSHISRRGALRTGSGVLAGLLAGGTLERRTAHAAPVPVPPPGVEWPVCSAERPDYCISRFEVDGIDRLADPLDVRPFVGGQSTWFGGSVDWNLFGNRISAALTDKDIVLGIRTGRLKPSMGIAAAHGTTVTVSGDDATGWEVTIPARVMRRAVPDPANHEQAVAIYPTCNGRFFDYRQGYGNPNDGMFMWTDAFAVDGPFWRDGGWDIRLSAPHFAPPDTSPDGLNHGSYACWMTPQALQMLDLTVPQALAGQLTITRTDNGVLTPIATSLTERAGGVLIDIPDLTYSSPTLRFANANGSKNQTKRKKGKKGKKGKGKGRK